MINTKFRKKHFLGMKDMDRHSLEDLIERSLYWSENDRLFTETLKNKFVANLFFEPSTRTKLSFEVAQKRLGAHVLSFSPESSSLVKGETVYDTVKTLESMGMDIAVIRHSENGILDQILPNVNVSIVNAGIGTEEHPSQSLLDLVTIKQQFHSFDGLKILFVGDIAHSRVAHSGMIAMQKLGMNVSVSGPSEFMDATLPAGVCYVELDKAIQEADIVMLLRVQLERHTQKFVLTPEQYLQSYGLTMERHSSMKPNAVIMHPAPVNRGVEIQSELVEAPNSLIFRQVKNGVAARMAILEWIAQ